MRKRLLRTGNIFIVCSFVFLLIGAAAAVFDAYAQYQKTVEYLIPVTEDVINSIYDDNEFFQGMNRGNDPVFSSRDRNITNKTAEHVKTLHVDMLKTDDLRLLSCFSALQQIEITNAEYLSASDIKWLNQSSVTSIHLIFKAKTIKNLQATLPDFSLLTEKKATVALNGSLTDELAKYRFFLMIEKYRPNLFCEWLPYDTYEQIDREIDAILSSPIGIDIYSSEEERIIKIALATTQAIDYDPEVRSYLNTYCMQEEPESIKELSDFYNKYPLSSSLLNSRRLGVCVNYSYIFAAVCFKLEIITWDVTGYWFDENTVGSPEDGIPHSWNVVMINDKEVPIDVDAINGFVKMQSNEYRSNLEEYLTGAAKGEYDETIMQKFINDFLVEYAEKIDNYYLMTEFPQFSADRISAERNVTYYNRSGRLTVYTVDYYKEIVVYLLCGVIPAGLCIVLWVRNKKRNVKG